MKKDEPTNEFLIRFLLGDLPETERSALEDRFLSDAELFAKIQDTENDLIDDYVGGKLDQKKRGAFENYYLLLPENRERVKVSRLLQQAKQAAADRTVSVQISHDQTFWQTVREFLFSRQFAPIAAVILFTAIGGFWLATRRNQPEEIAYSPTPEISPSLSPTMAMTPILAPTITPTPAAKNNQNSVIPTPTPVIEPVRTPGQPKISPTPAAPRTQPPAVTLALVAGLVRGGGGGNNLFIAPETKQVRLSFDLGAKKYEQIEARLETVAGGIVWRGKISKTSGRATLNLPADLFETEDYLLILSGAGSTGGRAAFQEFSINSRRK